MMLYDLCSFDITTHKNKCTFLRENDEDDIGLTSITEGSEDEDHRDDTEDSNDSGYVEEESKNDSQLGHV